MEARDLRIHFESGGSGYLTCRFQGKYLHSKYNPEKEGERFALSLQADFSPLCVLIIEPALSYCAPFLRKRFPGAELYAIRFSDVFAESDGFWDGVFMLGGGAELSESLFGALGEEKLISSVAFDWTSAKRAFPKESLLAWSEIKAAVLKARDVIGTRAYFSKRWLKNSLIFSSRIRDPYIIGKGDSPVVITASGPSLESSLPFLKKFRGAFFLIALSSSFLPLSARGIRPDLVMTSDGGYWAKRHFDFHREKGVFFAVEAEGAVPKGIFESEGIVPLCYEDGLERDFLEEIGCPYMISERNGTVAGTTLALAYNLTNANIYLCGFDQEPGRGFQHTQPNSLETAASQKDFRLRNAETRTIRSRYASERALSIYRGWLTANSPRFAGRVFRLSDNFQYEHSLGKIEDIDWPSFKEKEDGKSGKKPEFLRMRTEVPENLRNRKLMETLVSLSGSARFRDEVFPMDSLLIKREISENKKKEALSKIRVKISDFLEDCGRILR